MAQVDEMSELMTSDDEDYLLSDDSSGESDVLDSVDEDVQVADELSWRPAIVGNDASTRDIEFFGTPGLNPGIIVPADVENSTSFFLGLFLSDSLFEDLAMWTNRRAWAAIHSLDADDLPVSFLQWNECSANEVKKLIGMYLYMGSNKKTEMNDYWSTGSYHSTPYFQAPEALSRDRFKQLLGFLRFYDCLEDPTPGDPLYKIRPFLNNLRDTCVNIYRPDEEISVDESLVLYKGRLGFKQYIPTKRARYGIKVYCACESETGYLFNFRVHATPEENRRFALDPQSGNLSFSEKIAVELCQDLLDQGYRIFADKWFGSNRLAMYLLDRDTHLTCTIRADRGVPIELRQLNVPPNDVGFMRKGAVLAAKIVERKESGLKTLYLLDTKEAASKVPVRRIARGGAAAAVQKCRSALSYNRCMGGVDRMDGHMQPYQPARKTRKWFLKLGLHLCLQMVRNAWIVYCKCGGRKVFVKFLEASIREFVQSTGMSRRRAAAAAQAFGQVSLHFPMRIAARESQPRPTKRCRVCYRAERIKRSIYCCPACPGEPGLCLETCFQQWHS
ncbi:hypothetical protein BOX15_Mlig019614g1 [Macrostomum lignano]|uniref:Uncharacterized protein n=1 Tax=Macrostomum lignano TaxID=282301 RepID=A0A267FJJ3_9PLAT|nr:hypothetical protein BOX15_Mlig019614g1 [Macrostomum lignano]